MGRVDSIAEYLESVGTDTGEPITVQMSNEIVTLLSAQLYQSPLKAIEELVVNSYDADAAECRLVVPSEPSEGAILAIDNGVGMDREGLADLWHIARSKKRRGEAQGERTARKQIGKFGIGKLATYAIANRVTYISRSEGGILSVTTDFRKFRGGERGTFPVRLPVRKIEEWSDLVELEQLNGGCVAAGTSIETLIDEGHESWTVVVLEDLKRVRLAVGRLRWVLSTAMPLRSDFTLYLNGDTVRSSKERIEPLFEFGVAELPRKRIESAGRKAGEEWSVRGHSISSRSFPGGVQGTVLVTEGSLHAGKSSDLGRSHGFFVKVRGRLINEEDPLFGLSPLSFQTFNRFRAELTIDDLDEVVTAPREGIGESVLKERLLPLLDEIFSEARDRYTEYRDQRDEEEKRRREHERTYVPERLVEYPIGDALASSGDSVVRGADADGAWFYLGIEEEGERYRELIRSLYRRVRGRRHRYRYSNRGAADRLVRFDPREGVFDTNADHDLVVAYYDDPRARHLLEDVITAEVMLEAYLRQHGVDARVVGEILEQRDSLMRGLAKEHVFSLDFIGRSVEESGADEQDLEVALVAAARALGFVAKHIGGKGEPDGIGVFTDYPSGEKVITLEAKSSGGTPTLAHLDFAGLQEHKREARAEGCLLVAPRYPGKGEEAAVTRRAREGKISCWTVEQLSGVTRVAALGESGGSVRERFWI